MANPPQAIVRRKLSDEIFDRLKALITSGELGPGDAMPSERELMERFGVGRPAIREALQALANNRLVTISHGERARVREVNARSIFEQVDLTAKMLLSTSPTSLEHLKQARRLFERAMVREAAARATEDDVARLAAVLDEQTRGAADPQTFISADMRFHREIAAISRNPLFEAVSEAMLGWLRKYHTEVLLWRGKENLTLVEHGQIIRHIAANEADDAEEMMARHLDRSSSLYTHTQS